MLPGKSGAELAQELAVRRPRTRVLYMSGYSGEALERGALREGAPVLQKPFDIAALGRKVREALDQPA